MTPSNDVLLAFSFTLGGVGGQSVTVANVLAPAVLSSITSNVAGVLRLSPSLIKVTNVTDVATGAVTRVDTSGARRLGGAPGSQGVSISITANLGKVPTQAGVLALTAALAGANNTAALGRVVVALATSMARPVSAFAAAPGPAPTLANAPFELPAPAAAVSGASGDAGSGLAGAAGGGAVGGIVVLLCLAWMLHSRQKHGAIPCCRDYERERREAAAAAAAAREAAEMRRELEAVAKVSNPLALGGGNNALVIRSMSVRAAEADRLEAELARFKAQIASSVQEDAASKGALLSPTAKAPEKRSFVPESV